MSQRYHCSVQFSQDTFQWTPTSCSFGHGVAVYGIIVINPKANLVFTVANLTFYTII